MWEMYTVKQITKIWKGESETSGAAVAEYQGIKQRIKEWSYPLKIKQQPPKHKKLNPKNKHLKRINIKNKRESVISPTKKSISPW